MDVTPYLGLKPAPHAVFDHLDERRTRVRFMLPDGEGDWYGMTWQAFADQIRRIGQYLIDVGVKSGDRVAIFAPNSVEWISAALATQAVGGVLVPIYGTSTAEHAAYVVEHSDARVVFTDTEPLLSRVFDRWDAYDQVLKVVTLSDDVEPSPVLQGVRDDGKNGDAPTFGEIEERVTSVERVFELGASLDDEEPERFDNALEGVSLEQDGLMLYTSGTTGKPKGVPLTHRNVSTNGNDWMKCNAPLIEEGAVDLLWLPLSHVFGFGEACLGNTLGFTTYMTDPQSVLGQLETVKPSVFMSVPRYFEKLVEAAREETDTRQESIDALRRITGGNLQFCLSGGAGLSREVKELFYDADMLIIEGYGLTEASPTLTLNRPDDFDFDTVGKPLPSVELKIAEDGEILAKGDNIFEGYHKNPSATADTFTDDGWLLTGDLGRFTDDGFLQIIGRKKEILVTAAGKNVSPTKIEEKFDDDPYISHLVVYGDGKKYLVAGVWPNRETIEDRLGDDAGIKAIRGLLEPRIEEANAELASYETIKKFAVVDEPLTVDDGFLTPTLKVKRRKVYEAFGDELEALYGE